MTNKVILGIDPGISGAIAILADGTPAGFVDMPIKERLGLAGGNEVDGAVLGAALRGIFQNHQGAHFVAYLEKVNAMPSFGKGEERRSMGSTSAFNFGEGFGKVKCALEILGIPFELITPNVWKRRLGFLGTAKDVTRTSALQRYPQIAHDLARKKDSGRADALWIARYGEVVEESGEQIAA
jgi:hypothetical protein